MILSFSVLRSFKNWLIFKLLLFIGFCFIYLLPPFPGSFLTTLTSLVLQPYYTTYLSLNEPESHASNPSKWCSSAQEPSTSIRIHTDTYTETHTWTHAYICNIFSSLMHCQSLAPSPSLGRHSSQGPKLHLTKLCFCFTFCKSQITFKYFHAYLCNLKLKKVKSVRNGFKPELTLKDESF